MMTIADHQEEDEPAGPMRLSVAGQTNGPAREIKAGDESPRCRMETAGMAVFPEREQPVLTSLPRGCKSRTRSAFMQDTNSDSSQRARLRPLALSRWENEGSRVDAMSDIPPFTNAEWVQLRAASEAIDPLRRATPFRAPSGVDRSAFAGRSTTP